MEDGVILSQLINTKQVVRLSLGLAISMALSSLILWKGSWLASPIQSPYDEHGVGIFVGLLTCVASFVWSFASPASLRTFLERVFPPIMIVALLASRLFIAPMGFVALDTIIGFVIPAVGTYLFVFAWFSVIAAHNVEDSLLSILLAWPFTVALRAFFGLFEAEIVKFALSMLLICAAWLASRNGLKLACPWLSMCPGRTRIAISMLWGAYGSAPCIAVRLRFLAALFGRCRCRL